MNSSDEDKTLSQIKDLAKAISTLNEQAYSLYLPIVEDLIKSQSKDSHQIEHLLDRLLDFASTDKGLGLYKMLCRYYWQINPQATVYYVNAYREMWDSKSLDEENN
jgi:hypothetical protein